MKNSRNFIQLLSVIRSAKISLERKKMYTDDLEEKLKRRADLLYPTMRDKADSSVKNKAESILPAPITKKMNPYFKSFHNTCKKICLDSNTYSGKSYIDGYIPFLTGKNQKTGFYGRAYINKKNKSVIIAFNGTDKKSIKDWKNNFDMGIFNNIPDQLFNADSFYYSVKDYLGNSVNDYKINFTGYSLGGSLAELMGTRYGNETVTFNSYGVGNINNVYIKHINNIVNYGNINDTTFNFKGANHIGKIINTSNDFQKIKLDKNVPIPFHFLEYMGDLETIPDDSENKSSGGEVHVRAYTKSDGTDVSSYTRRAPNR